jgi:sugar/nucleoside kinase (ribokinase family)
MVDVVALGETMVQFNAVTSGPLRYVTTFEKHAAGTESNFTIGLHRMGISAGWISKLGQDEFGQYIYNFLRGEGVDVSHVRFTSNAQTGIYFVQRDYPIPGESVVFYYRNGSAASQLTPRDLPLAYIQSASIFHTTGITLALSDSCQSTVSTAIEHAKSSGVKISFDTNIRRKLWNPDKARTVILPYLESCDIIFTDINDTQILFQEDRPSYAAAKLLTMGAQIVVIKMGAQGAYAATSKGETAMKKAYTVPVIDVIGAGDAFDAAFIAGYLQEQDLLHCLEIANVAGALCVTVRGDVEAIPTLDDVQRFLERRDYIFR